MELASLVTTGEGLHFLMLPQSMGANSDGQLGDSTTVSRNSFETHWNRNNSRNTLYYTNGFQSNAKFSISGWGSNIQ